MKPETKVYFDKAKEQLDEATRMYQAGFAVGAGHFIYMAAYNAAQAVVFEKTDIVATSHRRLWPNFAHLVHSGFTQGAVFTGMLPQLYRLKEAADYVVQTTPAETPPDISAAFKQVNAFFQLVNETLSPAKPAQPLNKGPRS